MRCPSCSCSQPSVSPDGEQVCSVCGGPWPQRPGGWMRTRSGGRFYPLDPRPEDFQALDIAHALALVNRFGGHTPEPYSVAQHSVYVSHRAEELAAHNGFVPGTAALWGLLHDASEAFICDVPRPVKRALGKAYLDIEASVMGAICERFRVNPSMPWTVRRADEELLATEARDLLNVTDGSWGLEVEPLTDRRVVPWGWMEAEGKWMQRLLELTSA